MLSICGQMQRLPVYTIDIEDTQLALWQLVHKCISAVLRLRRGVGFLSVPARIFSDQCGTRGLSISLLGEPSTSAVPLTKLVLHGNNIAVGFGAAVCMQDILLQNGMSRQGGAVWAHKAKLTMHRCRIENCEARGGSGGALYIETSTAELTHCTFVQNSALEYGMRLCAALQAYLS